MLGQSPLLLINSAFVAELLVEGQYYAVLAGENAVFQP